jgi:hypothetical protein
LLSVPEQAAADPLPGDGDSDGADSDGGAALLSGGVACVSPVGAGASVGGIDSAADGDADATLDSLAGAPLGGGCVAAVPAQAAMSTMKPAATKK